MEKKEKGIIKSTNSGRMYVETSDFFQQQKVQNTIHTLLESPLVKRIEKRQESKHTSQPEHA